MLSTQFIFIIQNQFHELLILSPVNSAAGNDARDDALHDAPVSSRGTNLLLKVEQAILKFWVFKILYISSLGLLSELKHRLGKFLIFAPDFSTLDFGSGELASERRKIFRELRAHHRENVSLINKRQ